MKFYLGTHEPSWLGRADVNVPLFVSRARLYKRRAFPRALTHWALDSSGFSQIKAHGRWSFTAKQYVSEVRKFSAEIGNMQFCAIMDWMCEPPQIARSGLSASCHIQRTISSYLELKSLAPELPWLPTIQGFKRGDYLDCVELYDRAGVDLRDHQIIGVGSVCRRQGTAEAELIFHSLAYDCGLKGKLHAFGYKMLGLPAIKHLLSSSDSMSWSYRATKDDPLPGCTHGRGDKTDGKCANCHKYALKWRLKLLDRLKRPQNILLPLTGIDHE